MQHMLTVNVLMALAFVTSLSTQIGVHDVGSLVRADSEKVQGAETQNKEEATELRRQEIETKRLEMEQKNAAKRAAVTEKLSGKRAEQCEAKQDQINRMLDERNEAAARHLETFNAVQERLDAYVAEKKLVVEYSSALQIIIPEAQVTAQVAVENLQKFEFDCTTADAAAPGAIVKAQFAEAKSALHEYRASLIEYAEAVKAADNASGPETGTDEEESTNE